jgi:hypothetical protein
VSDTADTNPIFTFLLFTFALFFAFCLLPFYFCLLP